eukprot:SAG31_NODE_30934_length_374_cov_0.941818_1_plen_117_part_10
MKALVIFEAAHQLDVSASSPGGKRLLMSMKKSQAKLQVQNSAAVKGLKKKGEKLGEEKDFGGAVAAFERALKIDIKDATLTDSLTAALERMRMEQKGHGELMQQAQKIFTEGQASFE